MAKFRESYDSKCSEWIIVTVLITMLNIKDAIKVCILDSIELLIKVYSMQKGLSVENVRFFISNAFHSCSKRINNFLKTVDIT